MNICFLLGGFTGNGGIGRVTSVLSNKLCAEEDYYIYTLSYFNNQKVNLYELDRNVRQDYLFDKPINMTKGLLSGGILKLKKYLVENKIDILIACGALYYPISVLSCRCIKTKCICWEHSNVENSKDHSFQLLCRWFGAKKADIVVTLTKHDQKSYKDKYHKKNIIQIYNPIDENIFKYVNDYKSDACRIISVGRLSYQKNFELLIEIAREVLGKHPSWSWDIFGEGELRGKLQSRIIEYGLTDRLILRGQVNNLYTLYGDYSFLVMTSRYEGFPMTLLEGMACGLPLISFDILTGPNEIIEDGINGYLINPLDINQMINRINTLISNPERRSMMSNSGRMICDKFKLDTLKNDWKELIGNLLNT